jgi:hypothetical protein
MGDVIFEKFRIGHRQSQRVGNIRVSGWVTSRHGAFVFHLLTQMVLTVSR